MPDTKLPRVTMAEKDLTSKLFGNGSGRSLPTPGWNCPRTEEIAAYLDGVLDDAVRLRLESHQSNCAHCRAVVGDVIRIQRRALVSAPPALVAKAMALVPPTSHRPRWIFAPMAAAGVLACTVIAALLFQTPGHLVLPPAPTPAAPIIAKAEPAPAISNHETVRKPTTAHLLPRVITPRLDSVLSDAALDVRWTAVPHAGYYQVQVVTFEGDPVWEGHSTGTVLALPANLTLKGGKYFVWISAFLENGRVVKSEPVGFRIASSR
jgi:hypothetical protein